MSSTSTVSFKPITDDQLKSKWIDFYYRSLQRAAIIYLTQKIEEYTNFIIEKGFWNSTSNQAKATDEILNKVREAGERDLADLIQILLKPKKDKNTLPLPAKDMADRYLKNKTMEQTKAGIVEKYKENEELKSQLDKYITNIIEGGFGRYLNNLKEQKVNCSYCGDIIPWTEGIQSGLDRAGLEDVERSYAIEDSIPCCYNCNNLKGTRKLKEFHDTINKIHKHSTHLNLEKFTEHLLNRNNQIRNILSNSIDESTQALQVKIDQAAAAAEPTVAQVRIKNRIIKASKLLSNKEDRLNNIKKLFKIATNNSLDDIFRGEPQHGVHIHDRNPDGSEGPVIFDSGYELGQEYEENMNKRNLINIQDNIIQGYNNNSLPTHIENKLLHLLNTHDLDEAALILAKQLNKPNDNNDSNQNKPHDNDDIPF